MNLLIAPWIPVHRQGDMRQITYRELICGESGWRISLPRDDLEMACLQLLIGLTQAMFTPKDMAAWLDRQVASVTDEEFDSAIQPFLTWFDLADAEMPFMQSKTVKAKEDTPIQKLFIGLPEGNNHAFFNQVGEVHVACPSCTAIVLYNQASSSPSFGGGFKTGLRGMAPITTLVQGNDLRETVWRNVLTAASLDRSMPGWRETSPRDKPVWVSPIEAANTQHAANLGLIRGYFWQPAKLRLQPPVPASVCDCCGTTIEAGYTGFIKEKFNYTLEGLWPHPLSPRQWEVKQGVKSESCLSFTNSAPAWTQLSQFIMDGVDSKGREGYSPAPVVQQFREAKDFRELSLFLLVDGYRNKQAAVLERRHELFNLAAGWDSHIADIQAMVNIGIEIKDALRSSLFRFFKQTGIACHEAGQARFYRQSERLVHGALIDMKSDEDFFAARDRLANQLAELTRDIFDAETAPYRHRPEIYAEIAKTRASLNSKLKTLQEGGKP